MGQRRYIKVFIKFLIKNNIYFEFYFKFLEGFNHNYYSLSFKDYLINTNIRRYVIDGFDWGVSHSQFSYWKRVDKLWQNEISVKL